MKRLSFLQVLMLALLPGVCRAQAWEPANTHGVIVGVLSWPGNALSPFSTFNRKDEELLELLVKRGVPRGNLALLLDKQATLVNIRKALQETAARARPDATFVFYYAGHGTPLKKGGIAFCNYDCNPATDANYLELSEVAQLLKAHFKGKRVLLLADCCHSGGLKLVAETLHKAGCDAVSLTSADSSNVSCLNWTFTQTILDGLQGDPFTDEDSDGSITLDELAKEVALAMKYRETQRHNYTRHGTPGGWKLAKVDAALRVPKVAGPFAIKEYVWATHGGRKLPARIVGGADGDYIAAFYDYSVKREVRLPPAKLARMTFKTHKAEERVQVEWGGRWWDATILRVEEDFHLVRYIGWDASWDEWVLANRIRPQGRIPLEKQGPATR